MKKSSEVQQKQKQVDRDSSLKLSGALRCKAPGELVGRPLTGAEHGGFDFRVSEHSLKA